MAGFLKIALLLPTVLYTAKGHNMLVNTENKLGDCVLTSIGRLNGRSIRISIEAEDPVIRRHFEDTVSRLLAKTDAILLESESCSASIRLSFVDSSKSFKDLVGWHRTRECDTFNGNQYYFVMLPNTLLIDNQQRTVEEILNFCWKTYILNVNVLVEDENETVTLYTYFPFNKFKCRDSTATIHNRFINGSFQWNKELFPPKMDNLWQCPLKAIVWDQAPFIWMEHNQIYGIYGEIFKTLATMMNFSIEMVMSPEGSGAFYPNKTITGASKMLKDGIGDIILGASAYIASRQKEFALTVPFYTGGFYAAVIRPKLYRSLEFIFLPFDGLTWITLLAIVFAKWICQVLWKKCGNRCAAFRYCSTRLHTMAWLYAMFIVRSSYEGSIFRYLQNRPIQWIPQNIDEAIDHGYKFVVNPHPYRTLQQYPQLADHLVVNNAGAENILMTLTAYGEKYALIGSDIFLSKINNDPMLNEDYALIPKPISMLNYCMSMQKYSFLAEAINTRISGLLANGNIKRIYVNYVQINTLMKKGQKDERSTISLHHIKGAFILLAICTVVSTFVFVAELFAEGYPWLKKLLELFH